MREALGLAAALLLLAPQSTAVTLIVRVFNGTRDVTANTRARIFRAGERDEPLSNARRTPEGVEIAVPTGFYDVQAIREQDGRVVNIRWAERLVVMAYPDEGGRHLEVINFQSGFGALQVRAPEGALPDTALYPPGSHATEAAPPIQVPGAGYALFVVRAGRYDLRAQFGDRTTWQPDIEVPADRTRFLILSQDTIRRGDRSADARR